MINPTLRVADHDFQARCGPTGQSGFGTTSSLSCRPRAPRRHCHRHRRHRLHRRKKSTPIEDDSAQLVQGPPTTGCRGPRDPGALRRERERERRQNAPDPAEILTARPRG